MAYGEGDVRKIFRTLQKEYFDAAKYRFGGDADLRKEGFRLE